MHIHGAEEEYCLVNSSRLVYPIRSLAKAHPRPMPVFHLKAINS